MRHDCDNVRMFLTVELEVVDVTAVELRSSVGDLGVRVPLQKGRVGYTSEFQLDTLDN